MHGKYCIGVDFGTLSARALLVDVRTGAELATAVCEYPHAVMSSTLPSGLPLPPDWALQHPRDYIDCMKRTVPAVLREAGIDAAEVIGVGIDFTSSTMLAIDSHGTPLCCLDEYCDEPHAYVKLWKHHAAQREADMIDAIAKQRGEKFMVRYGNKVSSEWMIPKIWQVLNEAPAIYAAADRFIEAADWIVMQLTGVEARNSCSAGYKAFWSKREGYPSREFFGALDLRLENLVDEKLARDIHPIATKAGAVTSDAASWSGLAVGTAVAVAHIDAHVSLPPVGLTESGKLLIIIGTSNCHIMLSNEEKEVPGICGYVEDGVVPGLIGYEAGQTCVGDSFNWFVENCLPAAYLHEAETRHITPHALLTERAALLRPGQSGLIALDWWNGNRSVLVDPKLSGLIIGLTLATKPEEIYRALIEATAYGTRKIVETFTGSGIAIDEIYACGGIAQKNAMLMQIYADVLGRKISIARSAQTPALGSAMLGAVAAGCDCGGYDSVSMAAAAMGGVGNSVYQPISDNVAVYDKLYAEYSVLHDYFGRDGNRVMRRLKQMRNEQLGYDDLQS